MEKYLIIYQDITNDSESAPDLLEHEKNVPLIKDTFGECEDMIKADIEYWTSQRPSPKEVSVKNNGYMTVVSDSYGSCSYYIRKIIIE